MCGYLLKQTEASKSTPATLDLRPESILNSSINSWKLIRLELEKECPQSELNSILASLLVRQEKADEIILELSCEEAYLKMTTEYLDKINHCKNKIGGNGLGWVCFFTPLEPLQPLAEMVSGGVKSQPPQNHFS